MKSEHVAKVSDVGRLESGAPYMVMEFLEGLDLDQLLLERRQLPIETVVDYVVQAGEAIAEAHSLGIVHRDLKPRNLFLTKRLNGSDLVKVLDFGISKSTATDDMSLTSTTQVMGSPNYMSPEQLRSARDVDGRTDIWALGAILYELTTGRVPFVAETVTQLTSMVIQDSPRPMEQLRPDIPKGLSDVVLRCLEKRPEARFQSVAELCLALTPFASHATATQARDILRASGDISQTGLPPEQASVRVVGGSTDSAWDRTQLAAGPEPRPRRWPVLIAALGLLLVAGATATFALTRPSAVSPATSQAPSRTPSALPSTTSMTPAPTASVSESATATSSVSPSVTATPSSLGSAPRRPDGQKLPTRKPDASSDDFLPTVRN